MRTFLEAVAIRFCFSRVVVGLLLMAGPIAGQGTAFAQKLFIVSDVYSPAAVEKATDTAQADKYFQRAREACVAGDVAGALRLAAQTLNYDPDHADARRVMGYRRVGDTWAGNYAARRLDRGEVWHKKFGWIKAEDKQRWEAGERPLGKRWISIADDEKRHATIGAGWQVRTDHFRVVTNHSREEAARLATRLEMLYHVWQQQFGAFFLKSSELMKRFEGKEASGYRGKPFQVLYYKTREEYNQSLRQQQPQIGMTLGIYFDTTRTTHFFAGPEQHLGTIYHESVHQFFQESKRAARNVGALCNAWVLEGVACYFESLQEQRDPKIGHYVTLGAPRAGRLPAAVHRRLVDDYYVPLAELSALGMTDLQRRQDIARLYSQSAGLATFLMHYDEGRYRSALVKLMQLIYAGRDETDSLSEVTGQSFEQLDRQYREYLVQLVAENTNPPK